MPSLRHSPQQLRPVPLLLRVPGLIRPDLLCQLHDLTAFFVGYPDFSTKAVERKGHFLDGAEKRRMILGIYLQLALAKPVSLW